MPNRIDISASSMTGLLGAVEASKTAESLARKAKPADKTQQDIYDISHYKKGSALTKKTTSIPNSRGTLSHKEPSKSRKATKKSHAPKLSANPPSVQEQLAMEALERKSKIYEATIRGKKGGLSEKQLESCPLDIDAKRAHLDLTEAQPSSDSDDDDSVEEVYPSTHAGPSSLPPTSFTGRLSSTNHQLPSLLGEAEPEEEDWIEGKDEFGRDILIPASELKTTHLDPQRTLAFSQTECASHVQGIGAYYGSQTQFPVLEPTDKTIRKPGTHEPVEKYFDSKAERRQLGTGFYALSSDPKERLAQQEELRQREQETLAARSAAHKADHQSLESPAEKLIQDRKRLLQAKKDQLANKRLKKDAPVPVPESHATPS
ncbi:hypothetical protein PCASD_26330 [Puccinia coronata f. sp. avenae]|uniref:Uncharacterized protein n=1 Tax=Puccinia coronata f. sp. avenae TaxID=200324 RepID=A0A2N5TH04_9BASI|nr:hypothetical protein PCASD_26330 [Puccinia coronata f. sp. avenae]